MRSDECTSCLNCIDVCPVKDTLDLKLVGTEKKIDKKILILKLGAAGEVLRCTPLLRKIKKEENKKTLFVRRIK